MPDASNRFHYDLFHVPLSKTEKLAAEMLLAQPLSSTDIASFIGADDNTARARVFISKLRRKLVGTGWKITANKGGGHMVGTYRLERVDSDARS